MYSFAGYRVLVIVLLSMHWEEEVMFLLCPPRTRKSLVCHSFPLLCDGDLSRYIASCTAVVLFMIYANLLRQLVKPSVDTRQ